ncbi:hypothetical protein EV182_002329 [Spiromyces aspiralis]|uniref:Uncharacterized protein n=1 Tax=Spiromyces aspiralis TaxID=68401 RepID=A0ACC1HIG3_9FUNG|nr:hypothetical protein EV182_002329 [Spiromyces aspiralis]
MQNILTPTPAMNMDDIRNGTLRPVLSPITPGVQSDGGLGGAQAVWHQASPLTSSSSEPSMSSRPQHRAKARGRLSLDGEDSALELVKIECHPKLLMVITSQWHEEDTIIPSVTKRKALYQQLQQQSCGHPTITMAFTF